MSATIPILHQATFNIFPNHYSELNKNNYPLKHNLCIQFWGAKSVFSSGFIPRGSRGWGPKTMTEVIKISAFRNTSNGDEEVHVLQQEAFIDGSTEFQPEFLAGGIEYALNHLSKWLVAALFGAIILLRHDAEALWAAMGSVINAMLSVALKRILNQERPVSARRSDSGMPSSHAQSIFYTVMFAVLSIVEWLGINELSFAISGLSLAFGSYLSWLRVSQKLHTISQVVVGAALGSTFSILWYLTWNAVVLEAFASSLWVRIVVVLGAAGFCIGFLSYVIRFWFRNER